MSSYVTMDHYVEIGFPYVGGYIFVTEDFHYGLIVQDDKIPVHRVSSLIEK